MTETRQQEHRDGTDTDTCTARPDSRTRWQNIWGPC